MPSSQNTHWILGGVRGHLKNAAKLFNNVSGGYHSQSSIWTLIKHIQLEKLYMHILHKMWHNVVVASELVHWHNKLRLTCPFLMTMMCFDSEIGVCLILSISG